MYFGSSNSYPGLDGRGLLPLIILAIIGILALMGGIAFVAFELCRHLHWS